MVVAPLLLALLFALPARASSLTPSDQNLLTQALTAYEQRRGQAAEPILRDLAARYPRKFEVVETLGLIYAERAAFAQALPLLETATAIDPSSAIAFANLGAAYLRLNRNQVALRVLARAIALDPKNSQTQSSYGQALLLAKRYKAASAAFAVASSADPTNPDIRYNWALASFDAGHFEEAAAILAEIPASARSPEMQALLADIEEKRGHYDTALSALQSAARTDPSEANLNALGLELLRHWSFDPAIATFEYGISQHPSSVRLQLDLGIARFANSQYDQAARIFSRLLSTHPDEESYARLLGKSCVWLKGQSHQDCEPLLVYAERHPGNPEISTVAATGILEEHDAARLELARRLLEQSVAAAPTFAEAYYQLGVLDQQQAKWSESITVLQKAESLRPHSSKTHLKLALAYSHLNQPTQARQEAELQRKFRKSEEDEAEARRSEIKTFVLNIH